MTAEAFEFTDGGNRVHTTWADVLTAASRVSEFFRAVQARFVERDDLIRVLKYAFLLREHVLLFGPPGTGKTAIADAIIMHIGGAQAWSCDLSQFMSETRIFGDFDVKQAQETGRLLHRTEGSILDAHFANLGEFLDANTALLRSLLRVLNEREFIRGPQQLRIPLLTALANTNLDPMHARGQRPELEAVLDRFLFWQKVEYVRDAGNRLTMFRLYMAGQYDTPLPPLSIEDVLLVSGVILKHSFLTNDFILQAYEELARTFAEQRKRPISDRRLNKGLQILDASAILDGQQEVDWDDLDRVALIFVDRPEDIPLFNDVLAATKAKWQSQETQQQSNAEALALAGLAARIPTANLADATEAELVAMKRELLKLQQELAGFGITSPAGASKKQEVLGQVVTKIAAVQQRIDTV